MDYFSNRTKILIGISMLVAILFTGVIGYIIIEGDGFLDALYMTIITISSVGYGEIHELSQAGKIFTMLLILFSFTTLAYALTNITAHFFESQLKFFIKGNGFIAKKKMQNHVIICGYGRNGQQVARELRAYHLGYIIIEQSQDLIKNHLDSEPGFIHGDATQDEVLVKANIKSAKAVITTLPIDADNLYVVLTARSLNPRMTIISRASDESSERKLRMAGVSSVVMPERVGGAHMANLVTSPDIIEFLEHVSVHGQDPTRLEEIICPELPPGINSRTIDELKIRRVTGVNIIGYKSPAGEYILNPKPNTLVVPGAKLFVLGTPEEIKRTQQILAS
ncbi:MAG: potassium channel protein [Bacteroidetes bacterium]|nr:potassium channel protein [Bacteroidota bacterium]